MRDFRARFKPFTDQSRLLWCIQIIHWSGAAGLPIEPKTQHLNPDRGGDAQNPVYYDSARDETGVSIQNAIGGTQGSQTQAIGGSPGKQAEQRAASAGGGWSP